MFTRHILCDFTADQCAAIYAYILRIILMDEFLDSRTYIRIQLIVLNSMLTWDLHTIWIYRRMTEY